MRRLALILLPLAVACGDKDPVEDTGAVDDGEVDDTGDGDTDEDLPQDADGDGFTEDVDCDDADPAVNPDAVDTCDGVDSDCDGVIDSDPERSFYADLDGDGFGDPEAATMACEAPSDHVADDQDCDDAAAAVNPDATEVCDEVDNDCDGLLDDADDSLDLSTATTWYGDADRDGFGDDANTTQSCVQPPDVTDRGGDCDDTNSEVFPGDVEECNGIDDDCDGLVDDEDSDLDTTSGGTFYADADGDGYGDASSTVMACLEPTGFVADDTDCDDGAAAVNPGALEVCDGSTDEDCDGDIDEDDASDAATWYPDMDADGYGDTTSATTACTQPSDHVATPDDCNDEDEDVNPAADEVCDGSQDEDCDGTVDEDDAIDALVWYADVDGDGFGDASTTTTACAEPSGYTDDTADCDDTDGSVYPDAGDVYGDGVDGDCDDLDCEADWSGSAYFAVCPGASSWEDWRVDCQDAGYDDLASIRDATEDAFVEQLLVDAGLDSTIAPYIGYADQLVEGSWGWNDGATSTYTHWASGEPNNSSNEDCAHVNWPLGTGTWNDTQCAVVGSYSGAVCGVR